MGTYLSDKINKIRHFFHTISYTSVVIHIGIGIYNYRKQFIKIIPIYISSCKPAANNYLGRFHSHLQHITSYHLECIILSLIVAKKKKEIIILFFLLFRWNSCSINWQILLVQYYYNFQHKLLLLFVLLFFYCYIIIINYCTVSFDNLQLIKSCNYVQCNLFAHVFISQTLAKYLF